MNKEMRSWEVPGSLGRVLPLNSGAGRVALYPLMQPACFLGPQFPHLHNAVLGMTGLLAGVGVGFMALSPQLPG